MTKSTLVLYPYVVKLINIGFSTTKISKQLGKSSPTILKIVRANNEQAVIDKLQINNNFSRAKGLRKCIGHAKGKTYEELYGDKADEMREKRSIWLKENNIRKFATRISKPQSILFNIVKTYFKQAEIEYEIKINESKSIWLDIAIPDRKVNIEYDGIYWHNLNSDTISISDKKRDDFLKLNGWTVFRIRSMQNLNEEQLKREFDKLELIYD